MTDNPQPNNNSQRSTWNPSILIILLGIGLAAGVLIAILALFAPRQQDENRTFSGPTSIPDRVQVGMPAPDFTGTAANGESYTLSDLHGDPVAINFWATWCAPCVVEMPLLQAAYEAHKNEGFIVLAVNGGETPADIQRFMLEQALTFPAIVDLQGEITDLYETRVFPTTVWVNTDGIVVAEHLGLLTQTSIEDYLREAAQ